MQVEHIVQLLNWAAIAFVSLAILSLVGAIVTRVIAKPEVIKPMVTPTHEVDQTEEKPIPEKSKRRRNRKKTQKAEIPENIPEFIPDPPTPKKQVVVAYVSEAQQQILDDLTQLPNPVPCGWTDSKGAE